MNDRRQVGVAIVEDVGAGRVQEGGGQRIDALWPPDDGRLPAAGEFTERAQRQFDRLGAAPRDRHGKEVQQGALGFVAGLLRKVVPLRVDDEAGQFRGDALSGQHGYSFDGGSVTIRGPPGLRAVAGHRRRA